MNVDMHKSYLRKILFLIEGISFKIYFVVLLILISSLAELISLGIIGPYVATILIPDNQITQEISKILSSYGIIFTNRELIIYMSIALIFIFLFKTIVTVIISIYIKYICFEKIIEIRNKILKAYQNITYNKFLQKTQGELIYNIYNLTEIFVSKVFLQYLTLISEIIIGISILCFLAWQDIYSLSILILLLGSLTLIYDFFVKKKSKIIGEKANYHGRSLVQIIKNSIEAFKEIRVFGKENFFLSLNEYHTKNQNLNHLYAFIISLLPRYILELSVFSFFLFSILIYINLSNEISTLVTNLTVFAFAATRLIPIITKSTQAINDIRFGRDATMKLFEEFYQFKDKLENFNNIENNKNQKLIFSELKLNNVSFNFEESKTQLLKNISITIKKGEKVGIVGSSGSGKTTLLNMIMTLLKPTKGDIYLNHKKVDSPDEEKYLQSIIAYLPQETLIVDGTIKDNIAFGESDIEIDQEKIINSIEKAKLIDYLKNLKDGLDTHVGDRGLKISGGQRQRLSLARAFYLNRQIFIMDESTNALDEKTEKEIINEINSESFSEITFIMVTHKLDNLKNFDRVYEIINGELKKIEFQNISSL